jgi:hypothetical protein
VSSPITYHDVSAEQRALGTYMLRPDLAQSSGLNLADMDETKGHHVILAALLDQAERGVPGSFQMLVADLTAAGHLRRCGDGRHQAHAYLYWLRELGQQSIPQDADVARASIKIASTRRQIAELGARLGQVAASTDPDDMLSTASELSVALDMAVNDNGIDGDRPLPGLRSVAELLAMPDEPEEWIVPGLLARKERVILIAAEGSGKSVLSRQVGACVAAGIHPFLPSARYTPARVLLVDLENSPGMVRRNLARHVAAVGGLDAIGDRYHVWNWPSGLDVRSPSGRSMLVRAIEATRPDLLLIGPLYKMAEPRTGESYEEQASRTSKALDGIRDRYDVSLWIEHHMPKAQDGKRSHPFGSSLWQRWPEFGIRMEEPTSAEDNMYPLGRFRGDREIRHWPQSLVRLGLGSKFMWTGMYDDRATEHAIYSACSV